MKKIFLTAIITLSLTTAYAGPIFGKVCNTSICNDPLGRCKVREVCTRYFFWIGWVSSDSGWVTAQGSGDGVPCEAIGLITTNDCF